MSVSHLSEQGLSVDGPTPAITEKLVAKLEHSPGYLDANVAENLASDLGISLMRLMIELIPIARTFAVVPVSNYVVGSCTMGNSGNLYFGANLEFSRQSLASTVHSEQFASVNAMSHGEEGLKYLAVSSAPCGYCRQFLNEIPLKNQPQVLIIGKGSYSLQELLPHSFGPSDLDVKGGMMMSCQVGLSLPKISDELCEAALKAANSSYAPYSGDYSGVALKTSDGQLHSGYYAENAAFNPSMHPMQAAIINLLASGHHLEDIVAGALVEKGDSQVTQKDFAGNLLATVAPQAAFSVYFAS